MDKYEELKMELIIFESEDVITASPGGDDWGEEQGKT